MLAFYCWMRIQDNYKHASPPAAFMRLHIKVIWTQLSRLRQNRLGRMDTLGVFRRSRENAWNKKYLKKGPPPITNFGFIFPFQKQGLFEEVLVYFFKHDDLRRKSLLSMKKIPYTSASSPGQFSQKGCCNWYAKIYHIPYGNHILMKFQVTTTLKKCSSGQMVVFTARIVKASLI